MRPHPDFMAALESAIEAESDSDSEDEPPRGPPGSEAEVTGGLQWTGSPVISLYTSACRPLATIPETVVVW